MSEYVKPDWCNESTWENAKKLVFALVPESLMSRTGQRRIEIAATALMEEAKEAWEQVDVMSNWGIAEVSMLNKSVYDYVVHWEGRTEKAEKRLEEIIAIIRRETQAPPQRNSKQVWVESIGERIISAIEGAEK